MDEFQIETHSEGIAARAAECRAERESFARWTEGYGGIRHSALTHVRIHQLEQHLAAQGQRGDGSNFYDLLRALDLVTNAGMWLVVHQTYARNVYLDGRPLATGDFKPRPEGQTRTAGIRQPRGQCGF